VCRGKAPFLRGCKSLPARVAPAGSNRSNRSRREGDDLSEASDGKGHLVTPREGQSFLHSPGASRRGIERAHLFSCLKIAPSQKVRPVDSELTWQAVGKMISLISSDVWRDEMADLLVRGIDEELVRALKERAGAHGRSAEAEHREILAAALARPRRRSFAEVLASMPEVGADADFERVASIRQAPNVFD
jgi:plasmid stability protein